VRLNPTGGAGFIVELPNPTKLKNITEISN
jgi:hypothetical protein